MRRLLRMRSLVFIRIVQAVVVTLFIVAGFGVTPSISKGQTPNWTQPKPLSPQKPSAWFPDVAVDATGRVHVVWSSFVETANEEKYDAVMYTTSYDGEDWTEPVDIAAPELQFGEATRPTLHVDQQNNLHLTYRGTNVYYSQAPTDAASKPTGWISPRRLNLEQVAYFSDVATDSQGRLHAVFTENVAEDDCPICYHLFYRRSDNQGLNWSTLTDISIISTGTAKPQMIIDASDNIHLVWEAGVGGSYGQLTGPTKVMYAASYDAGETWTLPIEFITPGGDAKNVTIGIDDSGKLLVAWLGVTEGLVYYQTSMDQGHSWSRPRAIAGVFAKGYGSRLDSYTMVTDAAGQIHLVLVGTASPDNQESLSVLHLTWDDQAGWSAPEAVATFYGDAPEWPRAAIGHGNQLHIVWFLRDEEHIWESDKQEYQIWYVRGQVNAPRKAVALKPTSTPVPTATSTRNPTPIPTPTIDPAVTQLSVPEGASASIYTEVDDVLLLIQSLLPAFLVIGVVIFTVRKLRR